MTFRPTPSMIVALLALGIALGGSAYAANDLINGAKLKKYSVPGNRLKKNSLTGAEINESRLGTVPNAAHARFADSATKATHAATADSASAATDAAHATSADKLSGLAPSAFVQGGGQSFAVTKTLPASTTAETPAFEIPGLGSVAMTCSPSAQTALHLVNGTGQSVDSSNLLSGAGAEGGTTAAAGTLVATPASGAGQLHVLAAWPSGTTSHAADFTIGWFQGGSTQCTAIAEGVAR